MAQFQRYLLTHVNWRIATVVLAVPMVIVFWTINRWLACLFLAIGVLELVTLPYDWHRARHGR